MISRLTAVETIKLVTNTQAALATANLRLHKVVSNAVRVMKPSPQKI